jgi:tetratricopeptide (TPR) repeat protein
MAFRTGESRRVVAHAEQLREAAADNAQVAAAGIGVARACVGLLTAGQYALARSLLAVLPDPETVDPLIAAWVRRAHALRALHAGSYEAYLHASELAARDFAEAGDVRNANVLLGNAGHALLELGDTLEAIRRLRAVEGSMVSMGLARLAYTDVALGLALARAGDLAGAEAQVSGARDAYERMKDSVLMGISASALSSILRQRGDLARAEEEARTAVLLLSHVPPWRPVAAARLAGVLLDRGAAEEALRFAERAVADLDALGSVPVGESLVRLTHAVAMRACSPPKAARAIAAARSRLLERAAGITSAARRETFLTSVPENARTLSLFEEWRDDRTLVPHD